MRTWLSDRHDWCGAVCRVEVWRHGAVGSAATHVWQDQPNAQPGDVASSASGTSEQHCPCDVLDSELMHSTEGEGLEQGQVELHRYVMLGIGGHGHVLLTSSDPDPDSGAASGATAITKADAEPQTQCTICRQF
jgi:hypothetical protein